MHTFALAARSPALTFVVSTVALSTVGTGFRPIATAATRRTRTFSSTSSISSNTALTMSSSNEGLFLFDFDGVVCDSCDECTVSALRTCQRLGIFAQDDELRTLESPPAWLFDKMREIRPAIEVGWQIPVMLDVFLEQQKQQAPLTVDEMIQQYQSLVDTWLEQNSKTDADMIATFGQVRDDWIQDDLTSWLDINRFYPGVPDAMNQCKGSTVLVTTKQQRFAIALCRHAGVSEASLPDDKIYGLGQYAKKADVICEHMAAGGYSPAQVHFFEDRWPTLAKCLQDQRLDGVNLYLCAWGYVADWELELAKAEPRVTVLELDGFAKLVAGTLAPAKEASNT